MNDLKKEDGYILVVVIGILTILSLMTITFATLSRIETRATRNYTDSVKCEMVAKAGLEHALYIIRQDKFGDDDVAYNSDNGDENYDEEGDASWPGFGIFNGTDYDNDKDGISIPPEDSKWKYFPATDSSSDIRLPGKLRARYAVLITDDREARVNINVSGNQPGDEGESTTEIDMSSVIEQAPGLNSADVDNISSNIISTRIGIPFGVLTEAEIVGIAGASTEYTSRLEEIFENWIGSGWETAYEDRKRTLTAFSADTIVCSPYTLASGISTTMLNINALVNNGAYTDIQKVEMIMDVLYAGGIKGSSAKDIERHQLAVNIKDFIDSYGTVTTYLDVSTGDTYYGVDRTPYINEVEADTTSGNGKFIELFNPYDTEIDLSTWKIAGTTLTITIPFGESILAQNYYVISDSHTEYVTNFNYNNGNDADLYNTDVNSLTPTGETLILSDASGKPVQKTNYGNTLGNDTKTMQLNDPRPIPLTASASEPWEWTKGEETAGEENLASIFNPGDGSDGWSDTTWKPSFLVANGRFSNKGYLGFIHRGSEWSSFKVDDNITSPDVLKYITITDPSMDGIDNDGDGNTDSADTGAQDGDFDGPEYRIPGLINVNTAPIEVLASLPDGSGGTLGDTTIATSIFNGSKPYSSIGDLVVKVTDITDTGTDKWVREEPLRAISNLITTRSNVFTVYVTAQVTEEDVSDPPNTKVYAEKRIVAIVDRSVNPIRVRYFRWIVE